MYGLVQGEANSIVPGKRPLSAMSPTIVVGPDGKLKMLAGARGGPRIISSTFQVMSNVIDFGMTASAAVSAPRIHHQHLPDLIAFEQGGIGDEVQHALKSRGHALKDRGKALAITELLARDGDSWTAFPDPRRGGLAAGF
jgi:gamma-glutamyltranspeptidase/glutathione hydrolase